MATYCAEPKRKNHWLRLMLFGQIPWINRACCTSPAHTKKTQTKRSRNTFLSPHNNVWFCADGKYTVLYRKLSKLRAEYVKCFKRDWWLSFRPEQKKQASDSSQHNRTISKQIFGIDLIRFRSYEHNVPGYAFFMHQTINLFNCCYCWIDATSDSSLAEHILYIECW